MGIHQELPELLDPKNRVLQLYDYLLVYSAYHSSQLLMRVQQVIASESSTAKSCPWMSEAENLCLSRKGESTADPFCMALTRHLMIVYLMIKSLFLDTQKDNQMPFTKRTQTPSPLSKNANT
jgi:hypothetical protein